MTESESETNCAGIMVGVLIMIGGFFGGFMLFFAGIDGDMGVGQILISVIGIPMISFMIGFAIIMYSNRDAIKASARYQPRMGIFGGHAPPKERTYIYEIPKICSKCGGNLNAQNVEWAGLLTVRCPYCGATNPAEKRQV